MPSPSVTLLRTQTDARLAVLAAGGHERAFEAIVERYRRSLLRHARRFLPEARAEDALQQALLSAWTALRRGDEVRELRPWLHRIVHNSALNALRVAGYDYDELRETLEGSGGPAELAERRMVVQGTLAGLAALPERQRDALLQIAVEGRTQDEVAAELGLTQNAVRQLVHRARTALRAAATAVMPLPFATWLATAGADRGDFALRLGELVAGAGGTATLAKAGTVAVLAGGAVAGPAVVHDASDRARSPAPASARAGAGDSERAAAREAPVRVAAPAPTSTGGDHANDGGGGGGPGAAGASAQRDDDAARRDRGDGSGSRDGRSGSGRRDAPGSHRRGDDHSSAWDRDDGQSRSGDDDDDRSSGSRRRGDDSSFSRRSERRGGGDDDEADHGDEEQHHGGDDDQPAAGGGGGQQGDDDEDQQPTPSGGGSSGSGEHGDDAEAVPAPVPAGSATPSATPEEDDDESSGSDGSDD